MALSLIFDPIQVRTTRQRLGILAQGSYKADDGGLARGWSRSIGSYTWFEPIGYVGMIQPYCLDESWLTTNTGNYVRLTLADFGLTAGTGGWVQGSANENRLVNSAGAAIQTTTATYEANRGFYVSHHVFDPGPGDGVIAEYVLGGTVTVKFTANGDSQVWKGGSKVGVGSIGNKGGSRAAGFAEYILLPFGKRELLIYSIQEGDGYIHLFDDLDADFAPYNVVTPAAAFSFTIPTGSVDVEIAPLLFPTSGTLYSTLQSFAEAPATGDDAEATEAFWWHLDATSGVAIVVTEDDGTAFVANSSRQQARAKFALTGDGKFTPFAYAGIAGYDGLIANTPAADKNVAAFAQNVRLSVAESPANCTMAFTVRDPNGSELDGVFTQSNRAFRAKLGTVAFFDGKTEPPKDRRHSANDGAWTTDFEVRSAWKSFEKFRFQDAYPLDGLTLTQAITWVARQAGWRVEDSNTDFQPETYKLPLAERPSTGDWATIIEPGDSASEWFERLIESFAATWTYGFAPYADGRIKLRAGELTYFSEDPAYTIYDNRADAIAGGATEATARDFVFSGYSRTEMEPEATEIRVTGYDPVRGRAIQSFYKNRDIEDPTLTVGSRPTGWVGESWKFALIDPMLTTQDACDRACQLLAQRLAQPAIVHDWNSELLMATTGGIPLWQASLINIKRTGEDAEAVRINTLDANFGVYDVTANWKSRKTRYTAKSGAGAYISPSGHGLTIDEIRSAREESQVFSKRVRGGKKGTWLESQRVYLVTEVTL